MNFTQFYNESIFEMSFFSCQTIVMNYIFFVKRGSNIVMKVINPQTAMSYQKHKYMANYHSIKPQRSNLELKIRVRLYIRLQPAYSVPEIYLFLRFNSLVRYASISFEQIQSRYLHNYIHNYLCINIYLADYKYDKKNHIRFNH